MRDQSARRESPGLPFVWSLHAWLPRLGAWLPHGDLRWPRDGRVVAEALRHDGPGPRWAATPPDLAFVEVDTAADLAAVVDAALRDDVALLCLTGPDVPAAQVLAAQGRSADVAVLPRDARPPAELASDAGRATEELVRRRAYRTLLGHWRVVADRLASELRGLDPSRCGAPYTPCALPPLATIVRTHVANVLGLWWPTEPKTAERLEISPGTLRRVRSRPLPGLLAATDDLPSAPLDVVVVEVSPAHAEHALARLHAADATVRTETLDDLAAAHSRVEGRGVPDVAWLGLARPMLKGRLDFIRWMHAKGPSVVLCRAEGLDSAELRELLRLGVLPVDGPDAPGPLLRGLERARLRRRWLGAEHVLAILELESWAVAVPGVGDASTTLAELEQSAARQALEATGGRRAEAAEMLDIDRKRLGRILLADE